MKEATPSLQASLLVYDIPEKSKLANPSGRLRSRGIRINLSCWVIPVGNEPWTLLDQLKRGGATWEMARFDAGDAGKLMAICINALKTDIKKAFESTARCVTAAQEAATAAVDAKKATVKYAKRTGGAVRRLKSLLSDFEKVAAAFGIDPQKTLSIGEAKTAVDSLSGVVKARADVYAKAVADCKELATVDALALATAAGNDMVPWQVMADFLDEHHNGAGEALRQAFSEPEAMVEEPEPELTAV